MAVPCGITPAIMVVVVQGEQVFDADRRSLFAVDLLLSASLPFPLATLKICPTCPAATLPPPYFSPFVRRVAARLAGPGSKARSSNTAGHSTK